MLNSDKNLLKVIQIFVFENRLGSEMWPITVCFYAASETRRLARPCAIRFTETGSKQSISNREKLGVELINEGVQKNDEPRTRNNQHRFNEA